MPLATCILAVMLFVPYGCAPERAPDMVLLTPETIAADRTFKRRTLRIDTPSDGGVLVIETDGVVLDLSGGDLVGATCNTPPDVFVGCGIVVRGAKNVTIRNANIRGFKIGIYAEDAPGLKIENCDVSRNYRQRLTSTPEREHNDDWLWGHENDKNEWLRYGAGVYLLHCDNAHIRGNRARNGQNGICLVRCNGAVVVDNDMSFMSGWGLAMWRSGRCRVIHNRFDFCVRGYSHGVYARGQDSTGILVYEQCSDNIFAYNSATHGGDGFFLYAGNETVKRTGEGGCNRNVVYMNDFSYAVANGIEATFSDHNVFVANRLNHCVHGVWAGYSRNSLIAFNEIADCDNGVSIEHGQGNIIESNLFSNDQRGVHVWWDDDKDLLASPYGQKQGGECRREGVRRNRFTRCDQAIVARDAAALSISGNWIDQCGRVVIVNGETTLSDFDKNVLQDGIIENHGGVVLVGRHNYIAHSVKVVGKVRWEESAQQRPEVVQGCEKGIWHQQEKGFWHQWSKPTGETPVPQFCAELLPDGIWERIHEDNIPLAERIVKPQGTGLPDPLPGVPQGKEHISVNEWGPHDLTSTKQ